MFMWLKVCHVCIKMVGGNCFFLHSLIPPFLQLVVSKVYQCRVKVMFAVIIKRLPCVLVCKDVLERKKLLFLPQVTATIGTPLPNQ